MSGTEKDRNQAGQDEGDDDDEPDEWWAASLVLSTSRAS